MIDEKLNFGKHIALLISKSIGVLGKHISKSIGVLNKLKHTIPKNALRTIYYNMVHPRLLYGLIIWETLFKTYLKRILRFKIVL